MEALEVFPCARCGKSFDYINALKRHGKTCNANKPRKCKKCLQWFENQLSATRHEIRCFSDNAPLECPFCHKHFEHLYTLQRHYRGTHHIKMSKFRKSDVDFGSIIECTDMDEIQLQEVPESPSENNSKKPSQSVYTIEIQSVNVDPSVQTLVYNIRETKNSTEVETLPECVITDFDSIIQEDEPSADDEDLEQDLEYYEDPNIKIEYIEQEYYQG